MIDFAAFREHEDVTDTSETIRISSLALLKMLKHARSGVPMEVMGLMLGHFIDEYTIHVIDVFAMPQTGTGVTVEAVDPVYQTNIMDALKVTGRDEYVVGWYHSHPGFGCWLSNVDVQTQQSFEQLNKRAVAVVVDPIQSVKGKVVIDAFRTISLHAQYGYEPRQITSNIGYLTKPTLVSLLHGLNKQYYSFNITYKKSELEQKMLLNLHKKTWVENLKLKAVDNKVLREQLFGLTKEYVKSVDIERNIPESELSTYRIGRINYKRHLLQKCKEIYDLNEQYWQLHSIHKKIFQC